jgi:hypothetical protein
LTQRKPRDRSGYIPEGDTVALFRKNPVAFRILLPILVALALSGCLGNTGDPQPPPTNVAPVAGDGVVGVTWAPVFNVSYLAFGSTNPALNTSNFANIGFPIVNASPWSRPPALLCNATNGITYYFTVDARTGSAPGGPGSPVVTAIGRSAGDAGSWKLGLPMGVGINGVGYGAITLCQPNALPNGVFVAVGPSGAVFSSTDGQQWTSRKPSCCSTDLYGVVAYTANVLNPAAPGLLFVAVGDQGEVLRSGDGINWILGVAPNGVEPTLRAVALAGTTFVAVGDNGRIQTSPDGLVWTVQASNEAVNFHGVTCVGSTCVAVGDAGVVEVSFNGGGTWAEQTVGGGIHNLRAVAYGNNDNNTPLNGNGVIGVGGPAPTQINTWVIVGDAGTAYVTNALTSNANPWNPVLIAGAGDLVTISYTTHFLAIDSSGNAFSSELGTIDWSHAAFTGVPDPVHITTNGIGYALVGASGDNSTAF